MTLELQYTCKVNANGELEGLARNKLRKELKGSFANKSIEILIHKKKKHRSINQNRYYWLVLNMVSEDTGFRPQEAHEIFKRKFLTIEKVYEETGQVYEYTKSTTELSTIEFEEYVEQVRQFVAQEFMIYIPLPNEEIQIDFAK